MGALLGGMQQGQMPTSPMQGGVPAQAAGGTGMTGQSALGMGGQQGGNGLLTLLAPLLVQAMGQQQGGGQGGGLLSMLMGQQSQGGGSPQGQGAPGDVGGTQAGMNPANYINQMNPPPNQ